MLNFFQRLYDNEKIWVPLRPQKGVTSAGARGLWEVTWKTLVKFNVEDSYQTGLQLPFNGGDAHQAIHLLPG